MFDWSLLRVYACPDSLPVRWLARLHAAVQTRLASSTLLPTLPPFMPKLLVFLSLNLPKGVHLLNRGLGHSLYTVYSHSTHVAEVSHLFLLLICTVHTAG